MPDTPLLPNLLYLVLVAGLWLLASAIVLTVGSAVLFETDGGGPAVNLWLALLTTLLTVGSVYVGGELWTAIANSQIPAGRSVRVVDREGLTLVVEPE